MLVKRIYFGTDSNVKDVCTVLAMFYKNNSYLKTICPYDEVRGDIFSKDNPKEYFPNIDADRIDIYYRNVDTEKYVIINDTKITLPPNKTPNWMKASVDLTKITPTPPAPSETPSKLLVAIPLLALGYVVLKR